MSRFHATTRTRRFAAASIVISSAALAGSASAGFSTHLDLASWQAAAEAVSDDIRLADFDGYAHQSSAGGIDFNGMSVAAYDGTSLFPRIDNDSAFGGGWLVNRNNPGFGEFTHGFRFDFDDPVFAVSMNDNPFEANQLRLYDANDQLIAEMTNNTGQNFLGIVTDTPIAYATSINLAPEDGVFAVDNVRFAIAPAPGALAMLLIAGVSRTRRRRS